MSHARSVQFNPRASSALPVWSVARLKSAHLRNENTLPAACSTVTKPMKHRLITSTVTCGAAAGRKTLSTLAPRLGPSAARCTRQRQRATRAHATAYSMQPRSCGCVQRWRSKQVKCSAVPAPARFSGPARRPCSTAECPEACRPHRPPRVGGWLRNAETIRNKNRPQGAARHTGMLCATACAAHKGARCAWPRAQTSAQRVVSRANERCGVRNTPPLAPAGAAGRAPGPRFASVDT